MEAHANGITTTGDHASTTSMSGSKAGKATTPMSMGKSSKGAPNYPGDSPPGFHFEDDYFYYADNTRATPLTYSTGKAGKKAGFFFSVVSPDVFDTNTSS